MLYLFLLICICSSIAQCAQQSADAARCQEIKLQTYHTIVHQLQSCDTQTAEGQMQTQELYTQLHELAHPTTLPNARQSEHTPDPEIKP